MSEAWRCFVAVPIDEALRRDLAESVEAWRDRADLEGLRWTDPDGWHVTLAFLGSIGPADVDGITAAMETVAAAHDPTRARFGRLGGFPGAGRARVAWYGSADARDLRPLAVDLRRALGLDVDAPFQAHVTLGRARNEPVDLRGWLADANPPRAELPADRLELMRSHLGRGPARYERVSSVDIGARARV